MAKRTATVRTLTDRLVPGGIDKWLRDARADGLSLDAIALKLHDEYDITVTRSTIVNWLKELAEAS